MATPAHYGNGRSARRHAVTLARNGGGLQVLGEGIDVTYPLATLRLTEPFAHAAGIVYFDDGAHCEVNAADYPALATLAGQRPSRVVRWQRHWRVGELTRNAFTRQGIFKPTNVTLAREAQIRQVWQSVQPAQPRMPMTLLLRAMPASFGPNALALPNGTVVLCCRPANYHWRRWPTCS